jgi:NAD(P)-dependent dehydrogenase (short-subunit alcohol dehydrogenase family)
MAWLPSMNPPLAAWPGQVVWLVGASSGIGAACARQLHALGARVCVSARNAAALQALADAHPGLLALPCDATAPGALQQALQQLLAQHGRVDLVVYAAGHYQEQSATAFDLEQMLAHQQVNVQGALRCLDAVLPVLLRQGQGHISLVASVAGYRALPRALAYGPTKAALIHLAEGLYLDLAPRGLGVSVVNPGFVETPLTAGNRFRMPALMQPEQAAEAMLSGWAAGRFEIHFPRRFSGMLKLLRLLPYRLYFAVVRRATAR